VALFLGWLGLGPAAAAREPTKSLAPKPDYYNSCAISGLDETPGCLQVALDAIDHARQQEKLGPLRLPADYATLPFDQQMLLVVDQERVDRGIPPVAGLTATLDRVAAQGAAIDDLSPNPGNGYSGTSLEAYSDFYNPLDIDYQWVYDDGPGSGTSGCSDPGDQGCWADRDIVLGTYPAGGSLAMGAAQDPTGDSQLDDKGGPSMAMAIGADIGGDPLTYTWTQAQAALAGPALVPLSRAPLGVSDTGIADPPHTEPAEPDYERSCAQSGLDDSARCLSAILAAVNHARAAEGVKPMVLPAGFARMSVVEQLFVTTNLERADRGLPPFVGMSAQLDANSAAGAAKANDPPNPSFALGDDTEWSGGSVNGLDADYGWMYDDGRGSGNVDCPRTGGAGCWGHRNGILDNFGTVGTMVMGAAYDPHGDNAANGWASGTSMAMTLAAQLNPPASYVISWAQIETGSKG
jgi:hypothetical protein